MGVFLFVCLFYISSYPDFSNSVREEWKRRYGMDNLHFIRLKMALQSCCTNMDLNCFQVMLCQKKHLDLFFSHFFWIMFQYYSHKVCKTLMCAYFIHCHWPLQKQVLINDKSQIIWLEPWKYISVLFPLIIIQGENHRACGAGSLARNHWQAK